tara:strand:- start:1218 stop:2135 length:918 start_codon:yes stop_codon:yes gene_type:complete
LSENALKIKNLSKVYGDDVVALNNISLEVKKGDFYALLGPNGAGKSTTIGIVSSLVTKTSGLVELMGIDIDVNHSKAKKNLGVVGQEVNFNQFETVLQILEQQAGYFGLPRKIIKERSEYYLRNLGLWDKKNEQGRNLSGGMKRRLMVAKALINNPDLLILDEPTAGVDIELRRSLWDFLIEINNKGTTIILTTHYLEEAEKLCKNISIIDKGEIVKTSSMQSLLRELDTEIFIFDLKDSIEPSKISNSPFAIKILDKFQISVEINKSQNLNEIFAYLNENKLNILSMRNETNRLEELFLDLTEK